MISVYQIILAAVSAQSTNARIYEFLDEKLISSLAKPRLQVELNDFLTYRCEYLKTAHLLNNCGHPLSHTTREEQKKVLRKEVHLNSDLRLLVHRCQRRLWNLQSTGQPIPTCPTDWMYQDYPRLFELKQEQETQPLTVLCDLILDRYNLTHDKFIMDIIQSFQIEEMESQKRAKPTQQRVLSDTSPSVSNTQDEISSTTQVRSPEPHLVIPDIADDKGQCATTDGDYSTSCQSNDGAPGLPLPDMINIFPDVSAESVTDSPSPSVTPTSASVWLCSPAPMSPETSQECRALDDSVQEFTIPDFSTSVFPDMPITTWDAVIQDIQGEETRVATPSIPYSPATTLVSYDDKDVMVAVSNMNASPAQCSTLVCNDEVSSEYKLPVLPTFPPSATVADLDSTPRSSLAPIDVDNRETSYFVKSTEMMCPCAPVKKGIHTKSETQYPLVGSDIPHVYENRKIRKAHVPKSISMETVATDEMTLKQEKYVKELDAKRTRTRNFLRNHSFKVYKESTAYFEKEQSLKRKALYTSRYLKQAEKCAKLVQPVAPATATMTTNMSNTGRDCHGYRNPVTTMSKNMVSSRKRKLSSDHTPVVPAKVSAMEANCASTRCNTSLENPRLVLKLSRQSNTWTSCQVVQLYQNRSS